MFGAGTDQVDGESVTVAADGDIGVTARALHVVGAPATPACMVV
jgi:hypothetical protein